MHPPLLVLLYDFYSFGTIPISYPIHKFYLSINISFKGYTISCTHLKNVLCAIPNALAACRDVI